MSKSKRRQGGGRKSGRQILRDSKFGSRKERPAKKPRLQVTGKVQMAREGYVFVVIADDPDNDVFVKASKTRGALNGDRVKVVVTREKGGKGNDKRREGEIIEIIERSSKPFVGVLHIVGAQAWVLMQSRNMPYDISVPIPEDQDPNKLKGMKVAAVIDGWDRGEPNPKGHIVDILGEPGANDTEMHAILAEYGLPYRFEPAVEQAADAISEGITPKDLKNRRDCRGTLTFTIDPADAKDFDDALSFKKLDNGNYEVGVHRRRIPLCEARFVGGQEAQERVPRSIWWTGRFRCSPRNYQQAVFPGPGEDKLTFSTIFELTPKAKIVSRWFGRTVIRSDYRFAYETAQQIIDNGAEAMNMELRGGTTERRREGSEDRFRAGILEGTLIPAEQKKRFWR